MQPRSTISARVKYTERITPLMQRITLTAEAFTDFPQCQPGSYIKLLFNDDGSPWQQQSSQLSPAMMRTYTVRDFSALTQELVVDFVLHGSEIDSGPASAWAATAKVGDSISLAGPGHSKLPTADSDWVLFVGDETAIPAIATHLEALESNAQGVVILCTRHNDAQMPLTCPPGIEIVWLANPSEESLDILLGALPWHWGDVSAWVACEFSLMRFMRQQLTKRFNLERNRLYISSYWKQGRSEDQHKRDKRADMEQFAAQP